MPEVFNRGLRRVFSIWGNGDFIQGIINVTSLADRLEEARRKHPIYAADKFNAYEAIESEFQEFTMAIMRESEDRQADEAKDIIATCARFMNGEHVHERD